MENTLSDTQETNFLFWNINRNKTEPGHRSMARVLGDLTRNHQIDVLMLAEANTLNAEQFIAETEHIFVQVPIGCKKITVFVRAEQETRFSSKADIERMSCISWILPDGKKSLLFVAHLPDKRSKKIDDMRYLALDWSAFIKNMEKKAGSRTILVGDLNLNPFDAPMTDAPCFNATSCKKHAMKITRTYCRNDYAYFYNPMWNLLGDLKGVPGTFYYPYPESGEVHWNMLDQLLLRPSMLNAFDASSLRILTSCGEESLITKANHPNKKEFSDHLPLYFKFSFKLQGANDDCND